MRLLLAACLLLTVFACEHARAQAVSHWIASWGAAQQTPEPRNALPADDYKDMTLREIFHLSTGATEVRVKLSNAFGTAPLHLSAVHIARPRPEGESSIDPSSDRALTFSGSESVTIPPGAEYWSDPAPFLVSPLSAIAVSLHYDEAPQGQTGHPGSRATSYYVHGDLVSQPRFANPTKIEHWYQVAEIDVLADARASTVIAFGDSITDGHGATVNGNDRWPDALAARLQASHATANIGVVNAGIGGNRVLLDGLGPNALARFDRDVLARPGARALILLEGINDLGTLTINGEVSALEHAELVRNILAGYQQMIDSAHAHGLAVIGGTILPDGNSEYYHPGTLSENDRSAINQWIRAPSHFDAVADFDRALADPANPKQMLGAFDSGDHLHPSPKGYQAMAAAVPIDVLQSAGAPAAHK